MMRRRIGDEFVAASGATEVVGVAFVLRDEAVLDRDVGADVHATDGIALALGGVHRFCCHATKRSGRHLNARDAGTDGTGWARPLAAPRGFEPRFTDPTVRINRRADRSRGHLRDALESARPRKAGGAS
jgi:hypothetical protein